MDCPSSDDLQQLHAGALEGGRALAVRAHLKACTRCQAAQPTARGGGEAPRGETAAPVASVPQRIGRYVIIGALGHGGMGVVYDAWDPELDRRIALKVVNGEARALVSWEVLRARLLREAQAMARLRAPNVVQVYDAGSFQGGVFIAMERVEGQTLRAWLQARKRARAEVLEVFAQAGRGLAAAHAAGLVHRDFKPDNVLIGEGEVKVMDFGLARAAGASSSTEPGPVRSEPLAADSTAEDAPTVVPSSPLGRASTPVRIEDALTATGAMLGTPRYMSPEQYASAPAGAPSDQFSFCVALYEALYGEHPFPTDSLTLLAHAVSTGQVRQPPAGTLVPAWLRRILLKGLHPDPAQRFASMEALLRALADDPIAKWRRRSVGVAAGLALLLLVSGAALTLRARSAQCRGGERHLEGVWDEPTQAAIHSAFAATGAPYAERAWQTALQAIDGWTAAWLQHRREACEATRLRGEQSEAVMDLRMACLDRRMEELAALTAQLEQADASVVKQAVTATEALPALGSCGDVDALSRRLEVPEDPLLRPKVAAGWAKFANVRALEATGRYKEGLALARELVADARAAGFPPLLARTLNTQGALEEKTGRRSEAQATLQDAAIAATAAQDPIEAARAWSLLGFVVGGWAERYDEGLLWLRYARAALAAGQGADEHVAASVDRYEARLLGLKGDHAQAARLYQAAIARRQAALGPDHVRLAGLTSDLGITQRVLGHYEESLATLRRALELQVKTLGADHPSAAYIHNNLAITYVRLGRTDEAEAAYLEAKRIYEAALGPDHVSSLLVLINLGDLARKTGRPERALELYSAALVPVERKLGPDHTYVAFTHTGIAVSLQALGRHAEAIDHAQRGLELLHQGKPDPMGVAEAEFALARALWGAGRDRRRALELARHADALLAGGGEQDPSQRAEVRSWLEAHASGR